MKKISYLPIYALGLFLASASSLLGNDATGKRNYEQHLRDYCIGKKNSRHGRPPACSHHAYGADDEKGFGRSKKIKQVKSMNLPEVLFSRLLFQDSSANSCTAQGEDLQAINCTNLGKLQKEFENLRIALSQGPFACCGGLPKMEIEDEDAKTDTPALKWHQ